MERLNDIAATGDVRNLGQLTFLLERFSYTSLNNTPLHVATMKGHLNFLKEILKLNPDLAEELNSQKSSPLHMAAARGHMEIAMTLFDHAPDMSLSRDCHGRNPIHLAAIKGHVEVLEQLVQKAPLAAREKVDRGLTVLHLCVKHGQSKALKVLVREVNELINAKNDDGDTILHMAAAGNKIEMIEFLLNDNGVANVKVNSLNHEGMTALDVYRSTSRYERHSRIEILLKLGGRRGASEQGGWMDKQKNMLMVVASLIATISFQIGVNPAGGVWQEDNFLSDSHGNFVDPQGNHVNLPVNSNNQTVLNPHQAGYPVLSERHPIMHTSFYIVNTTAFVASLSIILFLMSGFPIRRRFFMWILLAITWIEIIGMVLVYIISIGMLRFNENYVIGSPNLNVIGYAVIVWICMISLLLFARGIGLSVILVNKLKMKRNMTVEPSESVSSAV